MLQRGKKPKTSGAPKENSEFLPLFKHVFMQLSKLSINTALHVQQCFVNATEKTQVFFRKFSNFQRELFKLHQILQMLSAEVCVRQLSQQVNLSDS